MAAITIPSIKAATATFGLERADNVLQLLNGKEVVTSFAKAAWALSVNLTIQTRADGMAWAGALAALSSMENWFEASPPGYTSTIYTGSAPTVSGSGQTGASLNIAGATPSAIVFRPGEYFTVNGELKIVTATCTANGSGAATVQFQPALRSSPSNGASLTINQPKAKFRLVDPRSNWQIVPGQFYLITLNAVEFIQ